MINSIKIVNFRGFEETKLEGCRRINVVVGGNGSGKTALLEALFTVAGQSPEVVLRLRQWRGYEGAFSGVPRHVEDAMWRDLFYKLDKRKIASISISGSGVHNRSVTVSYGQASDLLIPIDQSLDASDGVYSAPVTFEWTAPNGVVARITPQIVNGQLSLPPAPSVLFETFFFAANQPVSATETVTRFSTLSRLNREQPVVDQFVREFPEVRGLSIQTHAGVPMLFANVTPFSEKVPLNIVSGGINKLAALLSTVCYLKRSIVLIDEIENGFYFERLPAVWRSLATLADGSDCQIFATTHSAECLRAAAEALDPNKYTLIQAIREGSASRLLISGGEDAREAISGGLEVRR